MIFSIDPARKIKVHRVNLIVESNLRVNNFCINCPEINKPDINHFSLLHIKITQGRR